MQKPYVKVFHSQRELNITIAPILSGSIHFGSSKFKKDVIAEVCSILGYSSVKQGDSFDSFICNEEVSLNTRKTKKVFGVSTMVNKIYNYNVFERQVDYKNITDGLFKSVKKKSLIFLIGDFFSINYLDLRILSKKHEVVAIIVRDKFEENPEALGNVNLIDPETKKNFNADMNTSLVNDYVKKVKANDHKLYEHFQRCAIRFTKIYTHEEPLTKLIPLLSKK